MKTYTGTVIHAPDLGQYGDCYRTALGCLLDLPPEWVPHFMENDDDGWVERRDAWLLERGFQQVRLALANPTLPDDEGRTGLDALLYWMGSYNPGVYYILCGTSREGIDHAVIGCGGDIVHNPTPGCPVVGPVSDTNHFEFLFLIPTTMTLSGDVARVAPNFDETYDPNLITLTGEEVEHIVRRRRREREARTLLEQDRSFAMKRISGPRI